MGGQDCGLAAPELLMLRHWTILSCMTPSPISYGLATALIFTSPELPPLWYTEGTTDWTPSAKARGLRFRCPVMLMHKGWNDGCTASLRVLEWFMWLCDLNVNFCECLTAQVFRDQTGKQIHHVPLYPHLGGSQVCSWNIYGMTPTSAWAEGVTVPELMALSCHSLWTITKGS